MMNLRVVEMDLAITILRVFSKPKGKGKGKGKNELVKQVNVLTYGINKYMDVDGIKPSIHAEKNAIDNLPHLPRKKALVNVSLLVVRVSKTGKLGSSKPCQQCIQTMATLPVKKGYKIQSIYYSDTDGNIIETTIKKLDAEDEPHVSRYWKNKTGDSFNIDRQ